MNFRIILWSLVLFTFSSSCNRSSKHLQVKKKLLISNSGSSGVAQFDVTSGTYEGLFIESYSGGLIYPDAITDLGEGSLIVSSGCRTTADSVCLKEISSVLRYDKETGTFLDKFAVSDSSLLYRPYGSEVGPDGLVYVASLMSNSILRYDLEGNFKDVFAFSDGKDSLGLNGPNGMTFDNNREYLYVTTEGSSVDCATNGIDSCIIEFTGFPSLIMKYKISDGTGTVFAIPPVNNSDNPPSLAGILMAPDGLLYVSDFTINVVRVYSPETGNEIRNIKIDIGKICNAPLIENQYLGDMCLGGGGSIFLTVGGTSPKDPGGVVLLKGPAYDLVECSVYPTQQIDRPVGINIL